MLRKNDLVKQFELVVKQEIIEHNRAMSATNLALNQTNERIVTSRNELTKDINNLSIKNVKLSHDQETLYNAFKDIKKDFIKLKYEQFVLNERNHKEVEIIDQSVETVHRNQQRLEKRVESLEVELEAIKGNIKEIVAHSEAQVTRNIYYTDKVSKKLKEEILSMPSEVAEVKKEFMEELAMHKIDNAGLLKEIQVLKKTAFINEKKIENLYTLIERINKKLT